DKFVVAVPDHDLAYAVRVIALELCDQLSGSHGLFRIGSRTGALGLWMVMPERPVWLGSAKADRLPSASCYSRRGSPALAVEPEHVVHPVLLGGWWLSKPQSKEDPDEAAR